MYTRLVRAEYCDRLSGGKAWLSGWPSLSLYDTQHYLVLSVPLSFSCSTDASSQEPFLAVSVRFDMTVFADLTITMDNRVYAESINPQGIVSSPLDAELADTTLRLLRALASPVQAAYWHQPSYVNYACEY